MRPIAPAPAVSETLIKALSAKHYTATIGRGFWSPKGATPSRRDSLGGLRLPLSGESLMKTRDFSPSERRRCTGLVLGPILQIGCAGVITVAALSNIVVSGPNVVQEIGANIGTFSALSSVTLC